MKLVALLTGLTVIVGTLLTHVFIAGHFSDPEHTPVEFTVTATMEDVLKDVSGHQLRSGATVSYVQSGVGEMWLCQTRIMTQPNPWAGGRPVPLKAVVNELRRLPPLPPVGTPCGALQYRGAAQ